jgi:acetate kinase
MPADKVQHLLYEKSGLLGVSDLSADMRVLLASPEPSAREAIDLFTFRVASEVAVMANTLEGLDCLVFTGGIGEHASEIRRRICDRLTWLGLALDASANERGLQNIATADSRIDVLIIPTSEEMAIARHCESVLANSSAPSATLQE